MCLIIPAFSRLSKFVSIAGLIAYGTDLGLRNLDVASEFICKIAYKPFSEPVCVLKTL